MAWLGVADKRPRSSISPTIITRDGKPIIAVGFRGGSTIPTTVLQVLLDRLGATLSRIERPRVAQRNMPGTTAEPAFIASAEGRSWRACTAIPTACR